MRPEVSNLQLLVVVRERISGHLDVVLLLQEGAPGIQRQVGPLTQDLRVLQYGRDLLGQDFFALLLLWNTRNDSIIDFVVLDDLVDRRPRDADFLGDVGDGHPHRLQLAVLAESELDDPDFHREFDAGPLLQPFLQILNRESGDSRILLQQNVVGRVADHFAVVLGPALELRELPLFL